MPGVSGNPDRRFKPGTSGNSGGRPKGSKTYAVRQLWAEALDDPQRRRLIIEKLRGAVTSQKTVVQALESAARIDREIGLGSNEHPPGVVIRFISNIRPEKLGPKAVKKAQRRDAVEAKPAGSA